MDWTTALRSQQADFIQRLKSGHLLHCETVGQHSELTVISGERLEQLRNFCWDMAEKYKRNNPVRKVFVDNMKGKLGEEVVKARLANFVTEVGYEKRIGGDGKVDFHLTSAPDVGIQVKARHGKIETVRWSISSEEIERNAVLVCILIQEKLSEAQAEYHLIIAGFLPTNMMKMSGKESFGIDDLLYSSGLRSYLENLIPLKSEDLPLNLQKVQQEDIKWDDSDFLEVEMSEVNDVPDFDDWFPELEVEELEEGSQEDWKKSFVNWVREIAINAPGEDLYWHLYDLLNDTSARQQLWDLYCERQRTIRYAPGAKEALESRDGYDSNTEYIMFELAGLSKEDAEWDEQMSHYMNSHQYND
jgi:hypothetical protein